MSGDLCVFLVDNGSTHEFSVDTYVGAQVEYLQQGIYEQLGIPPESQVLIMDGGVQLQPHRTLAQYSCGTSEANPIFLFSKDTIQSTTPPSASVYNSSFETNEIKSDLERLLAHQGASIELVSSRTQLASRVVALNQKLTNESASLVRDQALQHQGWMAVVQNLEKYTESFAQQAQMLFQKVDELRPQLNYCQKLLQELPHTIHQLRSLLLPISVLDKSLSPGGGSGANRHSTNSWLVSKMTFSSRGGIAEPKMNLFSPLDTGDADVYNNSEEERPQYISLYDFLISHNEAFDLEQCGNELNRVLDNYSSENIQLLQSEVEKITSLASRVDMKRIGNFQSRLEELNSKMKQSEKLTQRQSFILDAFVVNNERLRAVGDRSVLADLCDMHGQQLREMGENHHRVLAIHNSTNMAKHELAHNLHTRLKWIMKVQEMIVGCEAQVLMKRENLRRVSGRVKMLEQSQSAPQVALLVVQEILRRKKFSHHFMKWGSRVSESSQSVLASEMEKRKSFGLKVSSHFIYNLLNRLWDEVPPFALDKPVFDANLPDVEEEDVINMFQTLPEFNHLREPSVSSEPFHHVTPDSLFPELGLSNVLSASSNLQQSQDTVTDESTTCLSDVTAHNNPANQETQTSTTESSTQTAGNYRNVVVRSTDNFDEKSLTSEVDRSDLDMDETLVHRTSYSLDDPPIEPFDDVTEATTYDDDDVINEPYDVIGGTATSDVTANYDVMKREEAGVKKKVSDGGFVIDKESREDQPNNVFSVSDESGSSSSESIVASLCSQIRNRVSQNKLDGQSFETQRQLSELVSFLTASLNSCKQSDQALPDSDPPPPAGSTLPCTTAPGSLLMKAAGPAGATEESYSDDNASMNNFMLETAADREGELQLDSLDSGEGGGVLLKASAHLVSSSCQASTSSDLSHAECQTDDVMLPHHGTAATVSSCEDIPSHSFQIQAEHQTAFNRALNALTKEKNSEIVKLRGQVKKLNEKVKHLEEKQQLNDSQQLSRQSSEVSCQISDDDFSLKLAALEIGKPLDRGGGGGIDIPSSGSGRKNTSPIDIMNNSVNFDRQNTLMAAASRDDMQDPNFGLSKTFTNFGLSNFALREDQSTLSRMNDITSDDLTASVTQSVITVPPSAANENSASTRNMLPLSTTASMQQHSTIVNTSVGIPTQIKIAVNDFRPNDLILVLYDESSTHYRIFSITNTPYFLNYDSFPDFQITSSPESRSLKYVGVFVSKELCKVRKTTNRFNLEVGQKFYRVKAILWKPQFPVNKADR